MGGTRITKMVHPVSLLLAAMLIGSVYGSALKCPTIDCTDCSKRFELTPGILLNQGLAKALWGCIGEMMSKSVHYEVQLSDSLLQELVVMLDRHRASDDARLKLSLNWFAKAQEKQPCAWDKIVQRRFGILCAESNRRRNHLNLWHTYPTGILCAKCLYGRKNWQPDNCTEVCMSCDSPFTLLQWKHHCRECGLVFCGTCAPKAKERKCLDCLDKIPEKQSEADHSTAVPAPDPSGKFKRGSPEAHEHPPSRPDKPKCETSKADAVELGLFQRKRKRSRGQTSVS